MRQWWVALLVLLAGCAQVPTSGPVVEVDQQVTDTGTTSFVRVLARPPQPGMTPSEIVQGFLDAASGFEDAHAVAKEYLTPAAARQWNPSLGVRVYGNDTDCALMVLPRSRSIGLLSRTCASISRAVRPPQIWMMRSARVDLQW